MSDSAKQVCRAIWHNYLEKREIDNVSKRICPEVSVIGTGEHEVFHSLKELVVSLQQESEQWNGKFIIKDESYHEIPLSEDYCAVYGTLDVSEDSEDRINYILHFRFTMIFRYIDGEWKLLHVHQSVPDIHQNSDEFFPKRLIEESNEQLKEKIAQKTKELEENNKAVIYYSQHDYLTNLINRYYCEKEIAESMSTYSTGTIMMMDVDRFKYFNDTYGHLVGDQILIAFSKALQKTFPEDIVSRIGGDEFLVYCTSYVEESILKKKMQYFYEIWQKAQEEFDFEDTISISVGVAYYPEHGKDYQTLFQHVDDAMYEAKKTKSLYHIYKG